MDISKVSNTSFKGLLTLSGPNKNNDVVVNTKAVSTITELPYVGEKEGNLLGIGSNKGAVLTMNNGMKISTFVPIENVIEAYKQAEVNGEAKLDAKYNPVLEKPLLDQI